MEDHSGLKQLLSLPWIYDQFQNLVGAKRARRWVADKQWKAAGGEKVVDVGCGSGDALHYLPADVTYVGFDISSSYIDAARRKFAARRATFLVSTAKELLDQFDDRLSNADLVICSGLLHHLDDADVKDVLQLANQVLKPGGRMICVEPAFLECQGRISHWIMSQDRGCNVRPEQEWKDLVQQVFPEYRTHILTNLIRIPYVHVIIEAKKSMKARLAA